MVAPAPGALEGQAGPQATPAVFLDSLLCTDLEEGGTFSVGGVTTGVCVLCFFINQLYFLGQFSVHSKTEHRVPMCPVTPHTASPRSTYYVF